jgi:integrase
MGSKRQKDYRIRDGKVYARITYTDASGKRRDVMRLADSRAHAKELAAQMRRELKDHGSRVVDADRLKFKEMAQFYEEDQLKPAKYHGDRKVSGLRSLKPVKLNLKTLVAHFGNRYIKTITPTDIEKFKARRLETKAVRSKSNLTIATVNRELELLRAVFSYARREGWIIRSPFERAKGIISKADETRRDRVLSLDEEKRLLDQCDGRREHLGAIVICGLDTAMRRGEVLKLRWRDVDLSARTITIIAMNSKTARERTVGITNRLQAELEQLWEVSPQDPDGLVFGIRDNFKNAWRSACKDAELQDFRFHDCRHTCITRWVSKGLPIAEIMRLSGHSTLTAFSVYVNSTEQAVRRGAEALDDLHEEFSIQPASELVN